MPGAACSTREQRQATPVGSFFSSCSRQADPAVGYHKRIREALSWSVRGVSSVLSSLLLLCHSRPSSVSRLFARYIHKTTSNLVPPLASTKPQANAGISTSRVPGACMTFAGGPGARHQPNHHHHHHHVSPSAASSALTARSLFDLARLHPDPYVSNGGLAGGLSYATTASHAKSTSTSTATTQLLPPPAVPHLRLTAREDSTRVKLQKQRLGELHRRHISGDRIPGFKTSAGTF